MATRTTTLYILLLLTAIGCQSSPQRTTADEDKTLLGYFPERCNCDIPPALSTLRAVTGGQSFRVRELRTNDDGEINEPLPVTSIREYPIVSHGPALSPAMARRLSNLLADPRGFAPASFCGFKPGYAFTLTDSNGQVVTVLICLKCVEWMAWLNGDRQIGGGSFTGIERELIALLRENFPADAPLQSYRFRNRPACVYHVEPLLDSVAKRLPEDQQEAIRNRVLVELSEMPSFAEEWRDNGGYADFTMTADGVGYIIHARPEHHAAIEKLAGFRRVHPKD
jgi:hypothetical protein